MLMNIDEHFLQRKGIIHLSLPSVCVWSVMFFSMMVDIILHISAVYFFTLMFRCVKINLCIRIKVFGDAIV